MVRQLGQQAFITFVKGLNTEAGPLTFPENSTIEDVNCVLTLKGSHKRRYGIKQEIEGQPLNIGYEPVLASDFKDWAMNTYTWKAPGNIGAKTFLVVQIVDRLLFYDISENIALPLSGSVLELSLTDLIVDKSLFIQTGCSFSSGKGNLFVCGKGLEPCYVTYDNTTNTVQVQKLLLKIRDSVGVDDGLENNVQPATLSNEHLYNLINQGWLYGGSSAIGGDELVASVRHLQGQIRTSGVTVTPFGSVHTPQFYYPTDTITIWVDGNIIWQGTLTTFKNTFNTLPATARKFLTCTVTAEPYADYAYYTFKVESGHEGEYLYKQIYIVDEVTYPNASTYSSNTRATTYVSNTANFNYQTPTQSNDTPYLTYYNSKGYYPSNAQQWFVGREVQHQINVNEVANFDFGNKRAPRGRCILNPFKPDRSLFVPSFEPEPEDTTRVIDTAFMGGRVFYLRQNQLLYSQVIEDIKQAGMCYTEGDPTSEDGFDVVDTDGGVITITDMGDAIALFELQNGLAVFAKNGIWLVTGLSSDEGFKATGYSVRKLSNLECVSKDSIVNVQGAPLFWATSGIYVIAQRDYVGYDVQSLSDTTIQSRYVEIPKHNLKNVKGLYNAGAQRVAWFYDNTDEFSSVDRTRETKALIYDVRLQAFYELDMDKEEDHPFLCDAFNTPYLSFVSLEDEVYDDNDNLVRDDDNNIVYSQEAIKNTDLTDVKYLAYEKLTYPAGARIAFQNAWYVRDPDDDWTNGNLYDYAWKDPRTGTVMLTQEVDKPTVSFIAVAPPSTITQRYYRKEEADADGKFAWFREYLTSLTVYTDLEEPQPGDYFYVRNEAPTRIEFDGAWYNRDEADDTPNDQYGFYYAWKNPDNNAIIYTAYDEPTVNFCRTYHGVTETSRYYRYPQADTGWYSGYHCYAPILDTIYTSNLETFEVGAALWNKNFFNEWNPTEGTIASINSSNEWDVLKLQGNTKIYGGFSSDYDAGGATTYTRYGTTDVVESYDGSGALPLWKRVSAGTSVYAGLSEGYDSGYEVPTTTILLTSCNFDDISFKDWGTVNYTSTFTTGANTCGDSFVTKDVVYLTTQLSRTEAVNYQGNVGNESSCLLQMKWDFEDTDYSHKWTTPVQIYRARRLFAPTIDDPHFDDISIRMPVITTKHKVRGDGHALQIKFTSEPSKNFEVLGWNLIIGARQ